MIAGSRATATIPSVRFLVIGASGFVGSAVARRVLAEGDELSVYVRDRARLSPEVAAAAKVFEGAVGDPNAIVEAARGCEIVVHAAAVHRAGTSAEELRWTNVAGTENVMNAAIRAKVERVVHVSCADVTLTNSDRVNWNEARTLFGRPLGEHARTKMLAEEIALAKGVQGIETVAIRPALVWGPGAKSLVDEMVAEGKERGIELVGGGKNLVSVIYIDNLVDAIVLASDADKAAGRAYYVHDNEFVDASEFYGALSRALDLPPPRPGLPYSIAYAMAALRDRFGRSPFPARAKVIERGRPSFLDVHNAIQDLDWQPKVMLDEGMRRLSEWFHAADPAPRAAAISEDAAEL
jgi:nucleoside-diphosphate-sugar epimerase